DVLRAQGVGVKRVFLLGATGRLPAVRQIAPQLFGIPVVVPPPGAHAARGAARQAAWALAGTPEPPRWELPEAVTVTPDAEQDLPVGSAVRQQYRAAREQIHPETAA
ncbi:sugar kinase, partial [Kitasatospora sp. NPDC058263]